MCGKPILYHALHLLYSETKMMLKMPSEASMDSKNSFCNLCCFICYKVDTICIIITKFEVVMLMIIYKY